MKKSARKNPRGYDGTRNTAHGLQGLLPRFLDGVGKRLQDRPDLIIAFWPTIIGERMAAMAKAETFCDGVLHVKVGNSTLLSLLAGSEKRRLLAQLRTKFPDVEIRSIRFRMG